MRDLGLLRVAQSFLALCVVFTQSAVALSNNEEAVLREARSLSDAINLRCVGKSNLTVTISFNTKLFLVENAEAEFFENFKDGKKFISNTYSGETLFRESVDVSDALITAVRYMSIKGSGELLSGRYRLRRDTLELFADPGSILFDSDRLLCKKTTLKNQI